MRRKKADKAELVLNKCTILGYGMQNPSIKKVNGQIRIEDVVIMSHSYHAQLMRFAYPWWAFWRRHP